MVISLIATIAKRLGALCVAFVIFWHLFQFIGPREATVVVRVPEPGVVVTIDHRSYPATTASESTVVSQLQPGRHLLEMTNGELVLVDEPFDVQPGQDMVLDPMHLSRAGHTVAHRPGDRVAAGTSVRVEPLSISVTRPAPVTQ